MTMISTADAALHGTESLTQVRQYLGRAIRLRTIAEEMQDRAQREALFRLANAYDDLAIAAASMLVAGSA